MASVAGKTTTALDSTVIKSQQNQLTHICNLTIEFFKRTLSKPRDLKEA